MFQKLIGISALGLMMAQASAAPTVPEARVEAALAQYLAMAKLSQPNEPIAPAQITELKNQLRNNLSSADVLKAEAIKQGLDQKPAVKMRHENAVANFYANAWVRDAAEKITVSEAELRQAYQQHFIERKVGILSFPSEAEAKQALTQLRKGQSFEALAKAQKQPEPNGMWLAQSHMAQLPESMSAVINDLRAGQVTRQPIAVEGEYVLFKIHRERSIEGSKPFKFMKDELTNQLRQEKLLTAVEKVAQ
ncbi:MAG: peptidyl-prolyl cis-trans isomerase [Neisseriaceae bacterium]|nr:peptidyl-prolyl cis-trans isomerase [Neisseriaceae bacterium]MBP6862871.1 peptidyl-prolyl cis-trans isomerase [Neisseriaceae bacterium]